MADDEIDSNVHEEDVEILFRWIAVKNSDSASFGQERRAGTPLEQRIIGSLRHSLLMNGLLCKCGEAPKSQQQERRLQ